MVLHLLFFEFLNRLVQLMRASNISDERIPAAASKIRFASRDGACVLPLNVEDEESCGGESDFNIRPLVTWR